MSTLSLQPCHRSYEQWWLDYLAYLASTPRNWIEAQLEPPADLPPEEQKDGTEYLAADLKVWWVILCLDGAPERMSHQILGCKQTQDMARDMLKRAENRFRYLIEIEANRLVVPLVRVEGSWRDGHILGYWQREAASELVERVAFKCAQINAEEALPWTEQFHVRAGIGLSVREAFAGLLGARCAELCLRLRKPEETVWASVPEVRRLAA